MWPSGQMWKPGPTYPATVAAWPPVLWFRIRIFCRRGSLTPDFMIGRRLHPSSPRHDHSNRPPGPVPTGCGARAALGTLTSRRLFLNGPGPHSLIHRHDRTNRPLGGVQHLPTRRRRSQGCASHEPTTASLDPAPCFPRFLVEKRLLFLYECIFDHL